MINEHQQRDFGVSGFDLTHPDWLKINIACRNLLGAKRSGMSALQAQRHAYNERLYLKGGAEYAELHERHVYKHSSSSGTSLSERFEPPGRMRGRDEDEELIVEDDGLSLTRKPIECFSWVGDRWTGIPLWLGTSGAEGRECGSV